MFNHPSLFNPTSHNVGRVLSSISIYERLLKEYEAGGVIVKESLLMDLCWAFVDAETRAANEANIKGPTPIPLKVFVDLEFVNPSSRMQYPSQILMGMWNFNMHARFTFGEDVVVMLREVIEGEKVFFLYYGADE
ncbi:hypothetical protein PQX77_008085 [Marasmius sp. AFHP31]|nr:hypothetical protein PQX77_008085 [Marasmius sp. AFHP31]